MTDLERDLRDKLAKATEGDWICIINALIAFPIHGPSETPTLMGPHLGTFLKREDALFITAAKNNILTILDAKDAEIERLRDALEPFAIAANSDYHRKLALGEDIDHWPLKENSLTLGDLRRARDALSTPEPKATEVK